jgi:inhibitor of cysteine peptidase
VAEVITPHTAWIMVGEGEVVEAIMDEVWDMMKQEMLAVYSGEATAETIIAEVGDSFILSLDSNPTTGYAWQAEFDDELLELMGTNFVLSSDLIGAGGIESFEFRALKKGETEITMVYKRSWEEGYIDKVIYSVHITEAED